MLIYSDDIKSKITDIELHISAIKHSFATTTEETPNSFRPFAVFFSDPETKSLVITSRPVEDEADYYTAISEMLFSYSTLNSTSVIFAIDATKSMDDLSYDLLEIYAACEEHCTIFSMPYVIDQEQKFTWLEDKFSTHTLESLEQVYDSSKNLHATLEVFEALYLHTHMDLKPFDYSKIKSFFELNNFEFVSFIEKENTENLSV